MKLKDISKEFNKPNKLEKLCLYAVSHFAIDTKGLLWLIIKHPKDKTIEIIKTDIFNEKNFKYCSECDVIYCDTNQGIMIVDDYIFEFSNDKKLKEMS